MISRPYEHLIEYGFSTFFIAFSNSFVQCEVCSLQWQHCQHAKTDDNPHRETVQIAAFARPIYWKQSALDRSIKIILFHPFRHKIVRQLLPIQSGSRSRYMCPIQNPPRIALNHFHLECLHSNHTRSTILIPGISESNEKMNMFIRENMIFDLLIRFCCHYWNDMMNRASIMMYILLKSTVILRCFYERLCSWLNGLHCSPKS